MRSMGALDKCERDNAQISRHNILLASSVIAAASAIGTAATSADEAADTLAAELRRQGHRCESPVKAERDAERSRPDGDAWVVTCTNATYRMRLVPHQAAHVEQI